MDDAGHPTRGLSAASVNKPSILLAVLVTLLVIVTSIAAMLHSRFDPRLTLFCAYLFLFYGTLYWWRRFRARHQHAVLRRGLGRVAVGLGISLSADFFYSFAHVVPLPQTIAAWLVAVSVAYCVYSVLVLHIEEEEEEEEEEGVNHDARPPV